MEHAEYVRAAQEASEAHEAGRFAEAIEILQRLSADASLPDIDRAMMAANLAIVLRASGAGDTAVEEAYDQGVALETSWSRGNVREMKALWLAEIGRTNGAVAIFESLATQGWASSAERQQWAGYAATLTSGTGTT